MTDNSETLKSLRATANQVLSELQGQVAPILQEIERKKREIALLDELLSIESTPGGKANVEMPLHQSRNGRRHGEIIGSAKEILAEAGVPLHVSELRRIFLERGLPIPGQGKEANLISHLRRSVDIVRIKRGFYAISDNAEPRRQVRRRRRRRPRSSTMPAVPLSQEDSKA